MAPVERQARSRDSTGVPTIKELIRAALDNGKTVRQLEADSGGRVRFQTFQEWSNAAPKNFPRDVHETITGMAVALGVTETTVVLAYARGLGVRIAGASPFALRVPPGVDGVDAAVQESMLSLMRAIVRMETAAQSDAPSQSGQTQEAALLDEREFDEDGFVLDAFRDGADYHQHRKHL
jgi:hypothetical protein